MKKKISFLLMLSIFAVHVFAQNEGSVSSIGISQYLIWIIYLVVGLLLLITYILFLISKELKRYITGPQHLDNSSGIEKLLQINPVSTDEDVLINEPHDGIYELDNPPPPWFMFLFYCCIAFAVIYFFRFSISDYGYTQEEEYTAEIDAQEAAQLVILSESNSTVIDESNVELLSDNASLKLGESIYKQNCKICHGNGGKGMQGSGPNLTDQYWKHGGGVNNVFKTVKYGVIEKGMVPWKDNLSPSKIQQVVSYILSLQGSNPEGAKEPEGDLWVPEKQ